MTFSAAMHRRFSVQGDDACPRAGNLLAANRSVSLQHKLHHRMNLIGIFG